jgi:hydrogenase maturation factor
MNIEDKLLFLKYALPSIVGKAGCPGSCSGALVKFSESQINDFVKQVSENKVPDIDIEKTFKFATTMCTHIAMEMGKSSIDSEVVREYFLFEHNSVVDERFELRKTFDSVACKTYPGKIVSLDKELATVETRIGKKEYSTSFLKDAKVGELVAVHFNYITERISMETEKKMNAVSNASKKLKTGV